MRFNDQNFTTVRVRWYFCSPNAKPLPFSTVYNSGTWWSDKTEGVDFGETGPRRFVDGSCPPWGTLPWPAIFPDPEPPAPLFFTIIQNTTEDVPPLVEVGQTFRMEWDPIFEWWFSEQIPVPVGDPYYVQIIGYPAAWALRLHNEFGDFIITQPRLVVVPYCLFPGVQPLGTQRAWEGEEFIADPVDCSIEGVCVNCLNVAGLGLPISTTEFGSWDVFTGVETWTAQVTWFDPHTRAFPSSARFDLAGPFEWVCPPGIFLVRVEVLGGGGGGGVADATPTAGGGGGGSSAWRISELLPVTPGVKYFGNVGTGGLGGSGFLAPGRDGQDGDASSFNDEVFSNGGKGGKGNLSGAAWAPGGVGGRENAWDDPVFSRNGFDGMPSSSGAGGDGGHSHYADGGAAGEAGPGDPGHVGSGGGGGGLTGADGGRGGDGLVVLIWGFDQPPFRQRTPAI